MVTVDIEKSFIDRRDLPEMERATVRRVLACLAPYRRQVVLSLGTMVIAALLNLISPLLDERTADQAIPSGDVDELASANRALLEMATSRQIGAGTPRFGMQDRTTAPKALSPTDGGELAAPLVPPAGASNSRPRSTSSIASRPLSASRRQRRACGGAASARPSSCPAPR
jgi:hypothetical protein